MASLLLLLFKVYFVHAEDSLYIGKMQKIQDFGEYDLNSLKGKSSLWYFYQPACESCKAQSRDFSCMPKDLTVLAIGVLGSYDANKKEFRKHAARAIPLYGGEMWQKKLNIEVTPTLMALDAQGRLIKRWQGKTDCRSLRAAF